MFVFSCRNVDCNETGPSARVQSRRASCWHLLLSLRLSGCLFEDSSEMMMAAGAEQSAHICPRAPLIPIIHKFTQRDPYPPSAL